MADPGPGTDGAWERYAAWEGTYRLCPWTVVPRGTGRRPRVRRLASGLLAALVALLVVGFLVKVVVAAVRVDPLDLLDVLLNPANALLVLGVAWLGLPPETRVTASALTVRSEPWRTRGVAWSDVVEVQPPGRFYQHPVALLTGGERLALVGLPADVANAMAAVTRHLPARGSSSSSQHPSSQHPSSQHPAPAGDLDGPFHRGWSRGPGGPRG